MPINQPCHAITAASRAAVTADWQHDDPTGADPAQSYTASRAVRFLNALGNLPQLLSPAIAYQFSISEQKTKHVLPLFSVEKPP
jgi:hypothetical protein